MTDTAHTTGSPAVPAVPGGGALDRVAAWLQTTYMAQVATRDLTEDVLKAAETPAVRATLEQVLADARRHEQTSIAMLAAVGREPARSREIGGVLTAKGREAIGNLYALSDGVFGTWRVLHQIWLDANNSLSAFAVAHGVAEAAGASEVAALAAPVIEEKRAQVQTLLQTLVATAPRAIIERAPV